MSRLIDRNRKYPTVMTAVYRLYDAAAQLLYVGIAEDFDSRFRQHSYNKAWWSDIRHKDVIWFNRRIDALAEEARAIEHEQPIHNRRRGHSRIGLMVLERPPKHFEGYDPLKLSIRMRLYTARRACPIRPELEFNETSCRAILRDFGSRVGEVAVVREGEMVAMAIPLGTYLRYAQALGETPDLDRMRTVAAEDLYRRERAPNTVSARIDRVLADMGV